MNKQQKCAIVWCSNVTDKRGKGSWYKLCKKHRKTYKASDVHYGRAPKHKAYYDKCASTIQSGIPIPKQGNDKYPFAIMEIGDSIEVGAGLSSETLGKYEKECKIKLLKRKIAANAWRVWRTA